MSYVPCTSPRISEPPAAVSGLDFDVVWTVSAHRASEDCGVLQDFPLAAGTQVVGMARPLSTAITQLGRVGVPTFVVTVPEIRPSGCSATCGAGVMPVWAT